MALSSYRAAARGRRAPNYVQCRRHKIDCGDLESIGSQSLWSIHDHATEAAQNNTVGAHSLLDVKSELARRMLRSCCLCERRCGVDRTAGGLGYCGVCGESRYFFEQTLWGEEPVLIPSHEVFFSGCNLRCKYCYSWESVLDPCRGIVVEPRALASLIDTRRGEGAANLNLIGGEPTVHLPAILSALKLSDEPTAVVWNSNFYMSRETMSLLDGVADLYLGDFRFGNEECARKVGNVHHYVETARRNFLTAAAQGDVIIRHLVVPGHIECCLRPIAEWVAHNLPDVPFNLMLQYTPFFEALDDPALSRSLTHTEQKEALKIVRSLGLNTSRWKRPLGRKQPAEGVGKGKLETTITIGPDGRVGIMHLHGELLGVVSSLAQGETADD